MSSPKAIAQGSVGEAKTDAHIPAAHKRKSTEMSEEQSTTQLAIETEAGCKGCYCNQFTRPSERK